MIQAETELLEDCPCAPCDSGPLFYEALPVTVRSIDSITRIKFNEIPDPIESAERAPQSVVDWLLNKKPQIKFSFICPVPDCHNVYAYAHGYRRHFANKHLSKGEN